MAAPFFSFYGNPEGGIQGYMPEIAALAFLGLTMLLLFLDLGRPERFMKLILKPNSRSWLVKGTWILNAAGLVAVLTLVFQYMNFVQASRSLRWINFILALWVSGYSAFLFYQCKGRDLWLGRWGLFWHLNAQAALMGSAFLCLVCSGSHATTAFPLIFALLGLINGSWIMIEKRQKPKTKSHALFYLRKELNVSVILFFFSAIMALAVAVGRVSPAGAGGQGLLLSLAAAALFAVGGLFLHDKAWVECGQRLPNS